MSACDARAAMRLRDRLARFFRLRVNEDTLAEDLVQEVFVRVQQRAHQLRDGGSFVAWVDRIARNVLLDHRRRRRPPESLEGEPVEGDPRADNENREVASWLVPMIERLPAQAREVLLLAEVERLPQAEVAERLGLTLSGAKSRIQRARERLRQQVLDCCHLELDARGNVVEWERRSPPAGPTRPS